MRHAETADRHHRLLVGVGTGLVEVVVEQGAERLHVQLRPAGRAVEAPDHEVPAAILGEQAALGHLDTGRRRHLGVGVLDRPVALGVAEFFLVLVVRRRRRTSAASTRIQAAPRPGRNAPPWSPGSRRSPPWPVRPRRTCRRGGSPASPFSSFPLSQGGDEVLAVGEDLRGQLDQGADLDLLGGADLWSHGRLVLERAHAASADIAEALDRVDALGRRPCDASQASIRALPYLSGSESASRPGRP